MSQSADTLLHNIAELVKTDLKPLVEDIDRKGLYPEDFLRKVGAAGGFAAVGSPEEGGSGLGLAAQIGVLREIGKECGATAFSAWCQAACGWYLHRSANAAVKQRYLADVLSGRVLAGTGMSNTVKHLAGIEEHFLKAEKTDGGYLVSGVLPWVSNLGDSHIWANTAQIGDGYVMFITGAGREGLTLNPCPEFCALEGTRTLALRFDKVFVPHEDVLAEPAAFADYIRSIKAGFILLQIGIGAGIIDGCLKEIELANVGSGEVNFYLENGIDELQERYDTLLAKTVRLADEAWAGSAGLLETLQTRAAAAELCLDAAQSAALHSGAKGYLMKSPVQRRVREAMFVAIVTPALKHLRKEISDLEFGGEYSI